MLSHRRTELPADAALVLDGTGRDGDEQKPAIAPRRAVHQAVLFCLFMVAGCLALQDLWQIRASSPAIASGVPARVHSVVARPTDKVATSSFMGLTRLAPAPPLPPLLHTSDEIPAADPNKVQTCLSFAREHCPPLNLSVQTDAEQRQTHARCGPFVDLERKFRGVASARFCGRRLKRLNPCWTERNKTSCLPHFFILGEMKCGTTSLYHFLQKHPRIVVPRVKEPRFLQAGRFAQTTVSRYSVNFAAAASRPDAVTFDASPIYLRSEIARTWLSKWLPDSRLIVLVRNPIQRSYSHWKMGREWMASKCTATEQLEQLKPLNRLLTFEALMERSLLQVHWQSCLGRRTTAEQKQAGNGPKGWSWMALPQGERSEARQVLLSGHAPRAGTILQCLVDIDAELPTKFVPELLGQWPNASEQAKLTAATKLLGHCSEMMLTPPGALAKGTMYASELEKWARLFRRDQLKVLHTDELSQRPQQLMDETFDFLSLQRIDIGNETRMCVHGKAGVMDVLNAFEGSVRIGTNGAAATPKLHVAGCDLHGGMHDDPLTGAKHHYIEPILERRMAAYYTPYNEQLYRFLGRDLHW